MFNDVLEKWSGKLGGTAIEKNQLKDKFSFFSMSTILLYL
jgi:hypothetical protein